MFTRYAVYYTPPPGPLAAFGAGWLGWDAAGRRAVPHPEVPGLDIDSLTEQPRRYGFHATVKPPFRLAEDADEAGLIDEFRTLCDTLPAITIAGLEIASLGRFLALVPVGPDGALNAVAAQVVERLDGFRAAPGADEIARRQNASLTDAQRRNLRDWGYPHVMDAYRFHITLTGKLDRTTMARTRPVLANLLEPVLPRPFRIDSLTLAAERADGMFVELQRSALAGAT